MSRILFILTLFALLLNAFSKGLILLSFEVNRDFISRNLCVQKDKNDNCCKGSCLLKKQLTDDDKKESGLPSQNIKDKADLQLFLETNPSLIFEGISSLSVLLSRFLFPLSLGEGEIIHPPPQA